MNEYEQLKQLHTYVKKSINTTIKENTLRSKLKECDELYKILEIKFYENIDQFSEEDSNLFIANANKWYIEIKNIVKSKLEKLHLKKQSRTKTTFSTCRAAKTKQYTMTEANETGFDLRQATSLLQPYDGSATGLDAFIDSAKLLGELIQPTHMAMAVKFIRTRLSGKARSGLPDTLVTINDIIDHVKNKCRDIAIPETIIAKLNSTKQRGQITSFCEDIENLCIKLENSYIVQKVPEEVAKAMTTKAGVNALINGTSASETKLILKAGNFASIKDALQKVQEFSIDNSSNSQIFNIRNKQNNARPNAFNRNNFRGNGFNRSRDFRNYSRGGYSSRNNRSFSGRYQRGGYNNHGRYNNDRPGFDRRNRMYLVNIDQPNGQSQPIHQNREVQRGVSNRMVSQQNQQQERHFLDQC